MTQPEISRDQRAALQQQRAEQAVAAINGGSNVTWEAYSLANEFTDAQTSRLGAWLKRVFRKP